MKQHPILYSTPMVGALLTDQKTKTRRTRGLEKINESPDLHYFQFQELNKGYFSSPYTGETIEASCPYGKPGDQLWVRETYCFVLRDHAHDLLEGRKEDNQYVYKTDFHEDWMKYAKENYGYKWKPSIYMPRVASRILLEVLDVRLERLHEITDEDIKAEGVRIPVNGIGSGRVVLAIGEKNSAIDFLPPGCLAENAPKISQSQLLHAFWAELWCKVNGRESWDLNPWVWVISFKRIS